MTTKPQSPIERLREIAAEQADIREKLVTKSLIFTGRKYRMNADGRHVEWNSSAGAESLPVSDVRAIAREILGMVEPGEVPAAQPEPTESKQEPWGYAVIVPSGGFIAYREKDNAEGAAREYSGTLIPLYAAPVKATGWIVKDKDGRRVSAICHSEKEDAVGNIAKFDRNYPDHGPHRVVGLAEVEE